MFMTFFGTHKDSHRFEHIHESPKAMTIPLMIFATLSLFVFFSLNPLDGGEGWIAKALERPESVVPTSVMALPYHEFHEVMHHFHWTALGLSLFVAGLGMFISYLTYYKKSISADAVAAKLPRLHKFLMNKWNIDDIYNNGVVEGTKMFTHVLRWFDGTIIDGIVNGVGSVTKVFANFNGKFDKYVVDGFVNLTAYTVGFFGLLLRKTQTGRVQTYIAFVVFGVVVIFFIFKGM